MFRKVSPYPHWALSIPHLKKWASYHFLNNLNLLQLLYRIWMLHKFNNEQLPAFNQFHIRHLSSNWKIFYRVYVKYLSLSLDFCPIYLGIALSMLRQWRWCMLTILNIWYLSCKERNLNPSSDASIFNVSLVSGNPHILWLNQFLRRYQVI
jgi:hypothetical protein